MTGLALALLAMSPTASADPSGDTFAEHITIRPDLRMCARPLCGGWWYQDLDYALTPCHDGTFALECYAAEIDLSEMGLSAEQEDRLLAIAETGRVTFAGEPVTTESEFGPLGRLVVTSAQRRIPVDWD